MQPGQQGWRIRYRRPDTQEWMLHSKDPVLNIVDALQMVSDLEAEIAGVELEKVVWKENLDGTLQWVPVRQLPTAPGYPVGEEG